MPSATTSTQTYLSVPDAAKQINVPDRCVRAVADYLGVAIRIGLNRAIPVEALDKIQEEVLLRFGFPRYLARKTKHPHRYVRREVSHA